LNHQPEAQHPKSSAIHKPPANYLIFAVMQAVLATTRVALEEESLPLHEIIAKS
jgi:hypothetical protein